jgi:hypothetical protein
VPVKDLFDRSVTPVIDIGEDYAPGRDAADARCARDFPAIDALDCHLRAPWIRTGWGDLLNASGAQRIRHVEIVADASDPARPGQRASQIVTYVEIVLAARDPGRLGQFTQAAFQHCAGGTPQLVHGVSAVVGAVPPEYGAAMAATVAFLTPDRVAWVVLDGQRPWTNAERDRALRAVAAHLS